MGLFNSIKINHKCIKCGQNITLIVQFKYGEVWQHMYLKGDVIKWGKPNVGKRGCKRVVVDAISEDCPICGNLGQDYEIWLQYDQIIDVKPANGEFDFVHREETYIIIEE